MSEYVLSWLIAILVHTILYWCVVSYHLVLLCRSTYLFVMHLTSLRISNGCADPDVPSTKLKCRNPQDREVHYKEVQGGMYRYRAVQGGMVL